MVWLSKHLPDLFKEESMAHGSTLKKKTSKDDPYGWMSDVFQGIFKEGEKKKVEVHKNGTFKINSNKRKRYNKFSS